MTGNHYHFPVIFQPPRWIRNGKMSAKFKKSSSDQSDSSYNSSLDSVCKDIHKPIFDIEVLGIFYDESPTDLDDIFRKLKLHMLMCVDMNPILRMFITIMKEILPFSLDSLTEMLQKEKAPRVRQMLRMRLDVLDACTKKLLTYKRSLKSNGSQHIQEKNGLQLSQADLMLFDDLFDYWGTKAMDFLGSVRDLCTVVTKAAEKAAEKESTRKGAHGDSFVRESNYTETIMKYSELFFLSPKCGDSSKKELFIRKKRVGCIPDVRFYRYDGINGVMEEEIVFLIQLKATALNKTESVKLTDRLKKEILGQIGAELLAEYSKSAFFNGKCLGLLCIRTEVIFVVLDLPSDHYDAIMENMPCDDRTAYIHYSKEFDILKDTDRAEMMEFMFWLACLQKHSFHLFYQRELPQNASV